MKFKLDENLPSELRDDLRAAGYEGEPVFDGELTGAIHALILERVRAEGRTLLTMNKGIADIRLYSPRRYAGLCVFGLRPRPEISFGFRPSPLAGYSVS